MTDEVGFIGVGIMGLGMCHNLIKSGKKLVVWNRDTAKAEALANEEASAGKVTVVKTAKEVIERCGLTYSCLSTLEASEAVWPNTLEGLGSGKMLVDCATLTPERMSAMAAAATAKGAKFLEAPVSGSKGPAEAGQLIFLCAGDEGVKNAAAKDLEAMGKATHYFGAEVGKGSKMKIVINMVMGVQLNAVAEGFALAESCGLDTEEYIAVLKEGAMASPMVGLKGPAMKEKNYDPAFPLKHAQKDMRFALQLGDDQGIGLPVAAASNEAYKKARRMGYGDKDFSAVAEASRTS